MRPSVSQPWGRVAIAAAVASVLVCGGGARAAFGGAGPQDFVPASPPTFPGDKIDVVERLGGSLPVDQAMMRHDGTATMLGAEVAGELPTIVTFNYASCPMLCSMQLGALATVLPKVQWRLGKQFRIVTIMLDPDEPVSAARAMRDKYIKQLPEGSDPSAWVFLSAGASGDGSGIRRIADSVGFRYEYIKERAEWAHPAALIFVSTKGRVVRYVYGVDYAPADIEESVLRAGLDETSTAAGFMLRCFHWDPNANNYSKVGVAALRVGAAAFVVLLLAAFGLWRVLRRHPRVSASLASSASTSASTLPRLGGIRQ